MLIATLVSAAALAGSGQAKPIEFRRTFVKGEKAQYEVRSTLNAEQRMMELETWLPSDYDILYKFNYEVTELKTDGICVMRYQRPSITEIEGETAESQPKTKVEKVDWSFWLTVSPVNEVLDMKEIPKKPAPKKSGGGGRWMSSFGSSAPQLQAFVGQFASEIYRLALFIGSLDSSMDFAPPLPVLEVVPGDTWKKTVGFSPQKLKGKGEKMAVQRLDFTYKYVGIVDVEGRKVHRIVGDLSTSTDLAEFIHQTYGVKSSETGLKEIPMSMKSTVEYDLDLKTHQTLRARARSEGGFKIVATQLPGRPIQEERFKARSELDLLASKRP